MFSRISAIEPWQTLKSRSLPAVVDLQLYRLGCAGLSFDTGLDSSPLILVHEDNDFVRVEERIFF